MTIEHPNCRCKPSEMEITCTKCDSDYDGAESLPKKEPIHVPPRNDEERKKLEEYNEEMKKYCPDFEPLPLTEEEYRQMIHEKAVATCGGIDNLNLAKALVGEKTPNKEELKKIVEWLAKNSKYTYYDKHKETFEEKLKRERMDRLNCR